MSDQLSLFIPPRRPQKNNKKSGKNLLSAEQKEQVLKKCGYKCVCGSTTDLHFHHIIPTYNGGPNTVENIIILCKRCHYGAVHGRKINPNKGGNGGRKPKIDYKTALPILKRYARCEITAKQAVIEMGYSPKVHMSDLGVWKKYLEKNGIDGDAIKRMHESVFGGRKKRLLEEVDNDTETA